jgi:predicted Ser/Thr protein kinase
MQEIKDTMRATVHMSYDGRVTKVFRGSGRVRRFENEVRVLRYLEERGCAFVPKLVSAERETLTMVTTSCGGRVDRMDDERLVALYAELETYGVRHEDAELRNVTYDQRVGRFCLIDFEFATILEPTGGGDPVGLKPGDITVKDSE